MTTALADKPTLWTRLAFGLGGAAEGVKNNGFDYFLLFFYSQILGVPASLVFLALMIALVVDAVSDPVVGYWSDNMRTRFGRRHPFMYAAVIPVGITYFLTWNPPAGLSTDQLFIWLVVFTISVRLAFTFYEAPSHALAPELTADYDARTSLMSFRYFFAWVGGLSIQIFLLFFLLRPTAANPSGYFHLEGWHTYGLVAAIVIFAAAAISTAGTHARIPYLKAPPPQRALTIRTVFSEIFETISNPSFRALFLATLFGLIATGVSASLNQYINGYFWGFTTTQTAGLTVAVYISAILALFIAPIAGKTLGKKRGAIIIGFFAFTIAPAPVFARLLGFMPPIGSEALYNIVLWVTIFDLALIISTQMLMGSMVADIVEDSEVQTGRRSEGVFYAGISFIRKLAQASGVFVASLVLMVAGIREGAAPDQVTPDALNSLGWGYAVTLLGVWMMMILCVSLYRISRESHAENLRTLGEREAAATGTGAP
ncbi:MAG: sugar transporter [Hyphomonas sp.]|uniref:MFS transporter n=1 Tax=Hyphomonas sp. TaxID=87 RepID=UPI0017A464CF|nr:MFS transporter [Hyphomonas sp.]MBU3919118.1 MFS transporter [Alphaproteobacteria bacterium]MBA3067997.1 sugar transporter [Hyphomonas sp.]MBU4061335.1 MFS transporter [Alphaproteobacteria bacterium]MBU4162588.1 MFS transporter [Alphaproteobacteria bacterium]MBU4568697.1 MFS transporter [Alphaproteobacteria bacterium]